jgi:hypothetical protein
VAPVRPQRRRGMVLVAGGSMVSLDRTCTSTLGTRTYTCSSGSSHPIITCGPHTAPAPTLHCADHRIYSACTLHCAGHSITSHADDVYSACTLHCMACPLLTAYVHSSHCMRALFSLHMCTLLSACRHSSHCMHACTLHSFTACV